MSETYKVNDRIDGGRSSQFYEYSSEATFSSSSSTSSSGDSSCTKHECQLCHTKFLCEKDLMEHTVGMHSTVMYNGIDNTTIYGCQNCNQRFTSSTNLINHNCPNKQNLLRLARCSVCGIFTSSNEFNPISKCSQCQDADTISHSIFSPDEGNSFINDIIKQNPGNLYYAQQYAANTINQNQCLTAPLAPAPCRMSTQVTSYNSSPSDKKFYIRLPGMDRFKDSPEDPYNEEYREILANSVREDKRFGCDLCSRIFKRPHALLAHRKLHSTAQKYKCEYCEKTFSVTEYYKRHIRTHTKEKPFTCNYCGKSFTQSNTLRLHIRIHTGEKPYHCTYCEKAFSVRDYLIKHTRTHTGEKPYVCTECGKKYSQSTSLKKHKQTHLNID